MNDKLLRSINDGIHAIEQLKQPENLTFIEKAATLIAACFRSGNKVLVAGNGGSLCDAAHFAEELTGFFRGPRPALPALALSEPGHLTCTANDLDFEWVFARNIEAFGKPGDVFVALTTSGNSPNIVKAIEAAQKLGVKTVSLLGKGGGLLKGVSDLELIIDGFTTSDRIQEAHMTALHIIVELVESQLFPANKPELLSTTP